MQLQIFRCAWCGEHLMESGATRQTRSDKRFCSPNCRNRYHRWLHGLRKQERIARRAIKALAEYLDHPIAQPQAAHGLKSLLDTIDQEAQAHGLKVVE